MIFIPPFTKIIKEKTVPRIFALELVGRGGKRVHRDGKVWESSPVETTTNLFLYGNYDLSFDEKNRLPIPMEIRGSLDAERDGNAFFIVDGVNLRLWLWPDKTYRAMVSKRSSEMTPGVAKLEYGHWNFGSADFKEMDKQNRIRIPDKRLKEAKLDKEVTLVGVQDHLELWNRPEWDVYCKELRARGAEIAQRARQDELNQGT